MKVIEILIREHGLILRALEILSRARIKIEKDQRPPRAFFDSALVFLREFADQFHHFKEEYLMFGFLALKKGDAFDGPIGGLRFQHERCRACIDGISNSLDGYADGDDIATDIIGRGGFSIIYKGIHPELNMPVAIKIMRHHLAMDPDFLRNFQNEAKIIASLNHENIIKVYEIEERFKTVFLIMEYLAGEPLSAKLKRLKAIPPTLAVDFLIQICSGFEMVVGNRPFSEDDAQTLAEMRLTHDIPDPAASVPDLPQDLQRFIIKACQRDPDSRYGDMDQALADLRRIAEKTV